MSGNVFDKPIFGSGSGFGDGDLGAEWVEEAVQIEEKADREKNSITIRKIGAVVDAKSGKKASERGQGLLYDDLRWLLDEAIANLPAERRYLFLKAIFGEFCKMVRDNGGIQGVRRKIIEGGGKFDIVLQTSGPAAAAPASEPTAAGKRGRGK